MSDMGEKTRRVKITSTASVDTTTTATLVGKPPNPRQTEEKIMYPQRGYEWEERRQMRI